MLLLLLTAIALVTIQPWAPNRAGPQLEVPSLGEAGVGKATAVAPRQGPSAAGVGVGEGRAVPVAEVVAGTGHHATAVAIGPAQVVGEAHPVAVPPQPSVPPSHPQAPESAPQPPPAPAPAPAVVPAPSPQLVVDFEDRDGDRISRRVVVGGDEDGGEDNVFPIAEGGEYALAFSFFIETMVYGEPGTENLVLRFRSDASDSLTLGLELWEPGDSGLAGGRGLWSSGTAAGGDRFLAPVTEGAWHDAVVHFRASSQGAGFYAVYLDGGLVDAREGISLIAPGSASTQIEVGLFRDDRLQGTSEIRLDAAKLGDTLGSVLP
jgi:hypothetical protein